MAFTVFCDKEAKKENKLKLDRKEFSELCIKYRDSGTRGMTTKQARRFYYLKSKVLY